MIGAAELVAFNAILLAAWISPGPAMLIAMHANLTNGRLAGIAAGLGLATTASLWTLAALLGLDALFTAVPLAYSVMKVLGGLYLMWVAVQTWRSAAAPLGATKPQGQGRAFRRGLLSNLYNPKAVLFSAAALALVVPKDISPAGIGIVTLNHFLFEVFLYTLLAFVLSTPMVQRGYLSAKRWIDRVAASLLGALGLRLLIER